MLKTIALALCLLACNIAPSAAQEVRATIGGRVTDAQGAVVPGATVVVTSEETGVKQQTSTNPQGNWIVQFLLPGHYRLSVTAAGLQDRRTIRIRTAGRR